MVATAYRDTFSTGVYFGMYHVLKRRLAAEMSNFGKLGSAAAEPTAGGFAGAAAWGCVIPVDVVKTRIQGQLGRYLGARVWAASLF